MKITFTLGGEDKLLVNLEQTKRVLRREGQKQIKDTADTIMEESVLQCPVATGSLRDSAFVEQNDDGSYTLGYGGQHAQINPRSGLSTDSYMISVHERLDKKHSVGKAKFLEDPVRVQLAKLEAQLTQRVAVAIRRLGL